MALTAAERQRKRREKLKTQGLYEQHQAKNAGYSKTFREREQERLDNMVEVKRTTLLNKRRKEDSERQRKTRHVKRLKGLDPLASTSSPNAYSASHSLNRATNRLKAALPKSQGKKRAVLRNLVLEFGDDATMRKKTRIGSIQKDTVDKVNSFYCRDNISRIAPGRRDVVTVRDEAGKKKLQKRHLVMSVKECYATFKESNPDVKIGVSKFAEIRPPNVLLSSETPSNVCQCIYHQNFILALSSIHQYIPDIPSYTRDFPSSCLVSDNNPDCWFTECDHHNCGFDEAYRMTLPVDDMFLQETRAKWMQWEEVNGRLVKCEKTGTVSQLYDYVCSMAPKFLKHCFVNRKQAERYEDDKAEASKPILP